MWSKRMIEKDREGRKRYDSGKGFFISVGATKGENLFEGSRLTAKYFFDALDMSYEGGLFYKNLDKKKDITEKPEILDEAFEFGKGLCIT